MSGLISRSHEETGVSPVVGNIIMVGIIVALMAIIAVVFLKDYPPPAPNVTFEVEIENTPDVREVKLIFTHGGGDTINEPAEYLVVWGVEEYTTTPQTENQAYENASDNGFSAHSKFRLGDNAVLYLRHDDANVVPGDYYRVRVYDDLSQVYIYDEVDVVKLA